MSTITIFGSGRLGPTLIALVGATAAILGARALLASRRAAAPAPDANRSAALLLGAVALVFGVVFLVAADGGPGQGDGVVGSAAAVLFGVVAIGCERIAAARVSTIEPRGQRG